MSKLSINCASPDTSCSLCVYTQVYTTSEPKAKKQSLSILKRLRNLEQSLQATKQDFLPFFSPWPSYLCIPQRL